MHYHHPPLEDSLFTVEDGGDDPESTRRLDSYCPQCVAAGADRVFVGTFDAGVHWTVDDGGFERVGESTVGDRVMALAINPTGTEPSRVYRSTDGGDSWHQREGLAGLPSSEWSFPPRPNTHHIRWLEPEPLRLVDSTDSESDCSFCDGTFTGAGDRGVPIAKSDLYRTKPSNIETGTVAEVG